MYKPFPKNRRDVKAVVDSEERHLGDERVESIPSEETVRLKTEETYGYAQEFWQTELAKDRNQQEIFGEATVREQKDALKEVAELAEEVSEQPEKEAVISTWVKLMLQKTFDDMAHAREQLKELEFQREMWQLLAGREEAEQNVLEESLEIVLALSTSVSKLGLYSSSALGLMDYYRRKYPSEYKNLMKELTEEYAVRAEEVLHVSRDDYDFEAVFAYQRRLIVEDVNYAILADALQQRLKTLQAQKDTHEKVARSPEEGQDPFAQLDSLDQEYTPEEEKTESSENKAAALKQRTRQVFSSNSRAA